MTKSHPLSNPKIKPFKFTAQSIKALPQNLSTTSTELEVSDTESKGLKCLVGRSGSKRFLFRYTFKNKKCSIALGKFPDISVSEVRNIVRQYRELLCCGVNPKDQLQSNNATGDMNSQSESERVLAFQPMTVSAFFWSVYLPYAKQRKRSWDKDESRFRLYIEPYIGKVIYSDLKALQIYQIQSDMISGNHYPRAFSPATCNRTIALLKTMGNFAYRLEYISENVALKVPLLKENNQRSRYFSLEEMKALLYHAEFYPNKYAGSLIALLLLTGARRNELQQAKWEYLDVNAQILYVPNTKNGKPREIYLSDEAMYWLNRLERDVGNPYIFARKGSVKPISAPRFALKQLLKKAGITDIDGICFHTARHSVATLLISSGKFNLYDVKAQLAHASIQSSQRYAKLTENRQRETGRGISSLLKA